MVSSFNAWVLLLKDEKGITITNTLKFFLQKSNCKPNKICVDKGGEFYNRSMKLWLQDNHMEMYSIHNEGYSAVAERFITILRKKVCKYITSVSKNVYIDKLDYIVTKNGTIHAIAQIK